MSSANDIGDGLTRNERNHFRNMAEHKDVVERVIAESDDEHPASRSAGVQAALRRISRRSRLVVPPQIPTRSGSSSA